VAKQLTLSTDLVKHYINEARRWLWTIATLVLTIMLLGTVLRHGNAPRELVMWLLSSEAQALALMSAASWCLRP
jgi:uncharacterized membrane protein YoaK (UPF0700 family)